MEHFAGNVAMVEFNNDNMTQCVVYDKTPGAEQKKINIIVRPTYSVKKVILDIKTQFRYNNFDLILQPLSLDKDLVYLNACQEILIYNVPGFQPQVKNTLVLLPSGEWNEKDVKKRYDVTITKKSQQLSQKQQQQQQPPQLPSASTVKQDLSTSPQSKASENGVDQQQQQQHVSKTNMLNGNGTKSKKKNLNKCNQNVTETAPEEAASGDGADATGGMDMYSYFLGENVDLNKTINTDTFNLSPMSDNEHCLSDDDDLALGASASPTGTENLQNDGLPNSPGGHADIDDEFQTCFELQAKFQEMRNTSGERVQKCSSPTNSDKTGNNYVGLVNQAMTCYLNSLLQALYMTPEFRNALYRWEFDNDNEAKNIPYQLQKLFLNLQTSKKGAVETTDLTRSFGWDSNEAWHQHDVQELCRVMFDALEHKFRNTKQANLISNLYEGKMIDYVKCLECNTEKSRFDTFLDIPLPVKPFGSSSAYGSIEEALRGFVQPEILNGNNQYFCEKCNKKCDAHKGLKFASFPYILTLHLKRFDFDYQTMHRIKLNDKVTFPQKLNLNSFAASSSNAAAHANGFVLNGAGSSGAGPSNTDDCSTTDSGSVMEEDNCSSGIATTTNSSQHENDTINDDDEGIDISSSTDNQRHMAHAEELTNNESGPYLYELFAIMIHSGSASGGHYYAHIKDLGSNEWYCFNDQSVNSITQEDIQKSFGGSSCRSYYAGAYTSSTNAYMLMYRQVDESRNEQAMACTDFPEHINRLLPKLHTEDEQRISRCITQRSQELSMPSVVKPRVYFYNQQHKKLKVTRVYVSNTYDIKSILESAHQLLNVGDFAPVERCRLVGYDATSEEILQSFEMVSDPSLSEIRSAFGHSLDYLLEYCVENQEFEIYQPGGATWYLYVVILGALEIDGPYLVYSSSHECNDVLKQSIAKRLFVSPSELILAILPNKKAFVAYDPHPTKEAEECFQTLVKSRFRNLTYLYLHVPDTDPKVLELLGIPPYDAAANGSAESSLAAELEAASPHQLNGDALALNNNNNDVSRESPLPPPSTTLCPESNSEDSSLSDGDRTLVESMQSRGGGDSQFSSASHSPQLSSPEDDATTDSLNRLRSYFSNSSHQEGDYMATGNRPQYFHAMKVEAAPMGGEASAAVVANPIRASLSDDVARKPHVAYKVIVATHMKMETFKNHIEKLIRVPSTHFTMKRKLDYSDSMSPGHSLVFLNEGETLVIELGKELLPGENRAKVYFMRLSDLNNESGKLECICEWTFPATMTVLEGKKELLAKFQRIDPKFTSLNMGNCRLWLKGGRNPTKILQDADLLVTDVRSSLPTEFLVQECPPGVNPQPSEESLTLFCRRWHPDTLQLDDFQEVTLEKGDELKRALSTISNIPEEHIYYAKVTATSFPCTNINLLSINSTFGWCDIPASPDKYPLTTTINGTVFFYKDSREIVKELNVEEQRELSAKESSRLDRLGCPPSTSTYSPRREKALKIYVDTGTSHSAADMESNVGSGGGNLTVAN